MAKCLHDKEKSACSICDVQSVYKRYRANAKRREIGFTLSLEDFKHIVTQPCHYCGTYGVGVDRKVNSMGYSVLNSVPCCSLDNFMKGKIDAHHYIEQCKRVAAFQNKEKLKWFQERGLIHDPNQQQENQNGSQLP